MDQRIINLYDEYTHAPLTRGEFINRLVLLTGSMAAALSILPQIEVNAANMKVTSEDDLFTERVSYPGVPGDM
ncbi:MAG TPA: dienelactone hydrolase family protein, partial [Ferruginibacter sp.]|nr:dienelactone hydrolase family protein [Ferruginibacter sp.]